MSKAKKAPTKTTTAAPTAPASPPLDLIVIVADLDAENTMKALLARPQALAIRPIGFEVLRYEGRDSGCYRESHDFARKLKLSKPAARWMVLFDRHGCGSTKTACDLEQEVEANFVSAGFGAGDVRAVVFDPELEIWVWGASPHIASVLGWTDLGSLKKWLQSPKQVARNSQVIAKGAPVWPPTSPKPDDPKEAYGLALACTGTPQSARNFGRLAQSVSAKGCADRAWTRFEGALKRWFPRAGE